VESCLGRGCESLYLKKKLILDVSMLKWGAKRGKGKGGGEGGRYGKGEVTYLARIEFQD
jgi:hypothetical protein